MTDTMSKADRKYAEWAAEHWCIAQGCEVTRRALRTKFAKVDFFGADVLGLTAKGKLYAVQATAGQDSAVTARRRKLEDVPWPKDSFVAVLQLRKYPDPANRRKFIYCFRVCEWSPLGWTVWEKAEPVPREWFKAA